MKERYYSESLLRSLAYDDDVNGNCDGMIDFTVVDSIGGADVAPVIHGEWVKTPYIEVKRCSCCKKPSNMSKGIPNFCPNCGADMRGGNSSE